MWEFYTKNWSLTMWEFKLKGPFAMWELFFKKMPPKKKLRCNHPCMGICAKRTTHTWEFMPRFYVIGIEVEF